MDQIIKDAKVYDVCSPLNGTRHNIWIKDGQIHAIDKPYPQNIPCIEGADLGVSPAWMDLRAHFCDPGTEQNEDLTTGLRTAAAGGFLDVLLLPDTNPVIQNKEQLQYIYERATASGLRVHVAAALTSKQMGQCLVDYTDLSHSGAVAFSDGYTPLNNLHVLTQALRYLASIDGLVMHRPEEASLAVAGSMHEGPTSTALGLMGIPAHAEEIAVHSALKILEYTGGRLHFSCLSSAGSLSLIATKRAKGLLVSADVSVQQLLFEDKDIETFDANYRSSPPYRSSTDRRALCRAVAKGHLQAIVSDHRPQAPEDKMKPFAEAAAGCITLQCVLPILLQIQDELPLEHALRALYQGPRQVLKLPVPTIQLGEKAALTVFDTQEQWYFNAETNHSKSTNSLVFWQKAQRQSKSTDPRQTQSY